MSHALLLGSPSADPPLGPGNVAVSKGQPLSGITLVSFCADRCWPRPIFSL